MKLNDKAKEVADNWIEWAKCYSDINTEVESKNPSAEKLLELFKKRDHLTRQRDTLMKELQTLVNKTSADVKIKIDKIFPSK